MSYGEYWAYQVVNAVLQSPAWPRTLLIYTYDEHGGYYDHVPPPAAIAPDSIAPELGPGDVPGGYDIYGPRVPGIVASPYSKPNAVTNVVHDHTSVLATIEAKWNLPALTYRDANAKTVKDFLDLKRPRMLEPPPIAEPPVPVGRGRRAEDARSGATRRSAPRQVAILRSRRRRVLGRSRRSSAGAAHRPPSERARAAAPRPSSPPKVRHVFFIVLENEDYGAPSGNRPPTPTWPDPPGPGRAARGLLRDRSREQRQLHRARLRPAAQPREPGRLPGLQRIPRRALTPKGSRAAIGLRVSGVGREHRHPADGRRTQVEGLHAGHGQRPQPRGRGLRAPGARGEGRNPGSGRRRRLRHPPRPVRVLPVGDRRPDLLRRARGRAGLAQRSDAGGGAEGRDRARDRPKRASSDAHLLVHHAQPLRRRARLPVQEPAERRLCAGRHRRLPGNLGADDHRLAGLQEGRPARDHLRRVRRAAVGLLLVLRREAGPGLAAARASPAPAAGGSGPC